jgi:hypothetical protein
MVCGESWKPVSKMHLFQKCSFSVVTFRVRGSLMRMERTFCVIKVKDKYLGIYILTWYEIESFDTLADLIADFPIILRNAHFVLIPGPLDLTSTSSAIFPKKPITLPPSSRLKSRIPNIHLATNPCRILFCGQEIVVFRDDIMARIMRNCVLQHKPLSGEELKKFVRLKNFVCSC